MAPRKGQQQFAAEAQLLKSMSTLAQRDFMKSHLSSLVNSHQTSRASSIASKKHHEDQSSFTAKQTVAPASKKPAPDQISMIDLHNAVSALANAPALVLPRKRAAPQPTADSASSVSFSASRASSAVSSAIPIQKCRRLEGRADASALFKGLTSIPLDKAVAASQVADVAASRCAVAPLWSLIGTFKVAMTSVVDVDLAERALKWHQRNPKGGFIAMRVSLQLITEISLGKLALEDQQVAETTYSVIIKTASGKPSQVVFGFASLREASRLKALLKDRATSHSQ